MLRRHTLLLTPCFTYLLACQPALPPEQPAEKKCSASKQVAANKKLLSAGEHYTALLGAADPKVKEDEIAAVIGAARDSYELCPSGPAAFYYGASLFQRASREKQTDAYYHNIAQARCLLEEALETSGDERVGDEDVRRTARALVKETIDRGAARLTVKAADGQLTVTSGDGEAKHQHDLTGEPMSLCLMPGPYDVSVHSKSAGDGTAVITVRPGENEKAFFEPRRPGEQIQKVVGVGVIWLGIVPFTLGSFITPFSSGALDECSSAPGLGKKCTNAPYLNHLHTFGLTLQVGGLVVMLATTAAGLILERLVPPKYQVRVTQPSP